VVAFIIICKQYSLSQLSYYHWKNNLFQYRMIFLLKQVWIWSLL